MQTISKTGKKGLRAAVLLGLALFVAMGLVSAVQAKGPVVPAGAWLAGDFHTHTFLTDGSHTQWDVVAHAYARFGLDWMANSEHGGASDRNPNGMPWSLVSPLPTFLGDPAAGKMWRWQTIRDYSYPIVAEARKTFTDRLMIQGIEWNVPSHEHSSVGIVGTDENGGLAISQFGYLFDSSDSGTTSDIELGVSGKNTTNNHAKAVAGAAWLQQHYPQTSYFLLNHPSRRLKYSIADIRDFNNAAPDVAFGMEGLPGHQKEPGRGGYNYTLPADQDKARTYGGADYMAAKVGGLWDALLGEGRHFWIFVNSDFHSSAADADFWPGEYAKSYTYAKDEDGDGDISAEELVNGLRSGNSFAVHGDLIDALDFNVSMKKATATMGETLSVKKGSTVVVTIRFRSPAKNNNGDAPKVNHVDLIQGAVTGLIQPGAVDYTNAENASTVVAARFNSANWTAKDGWTTVKYTLKNVQNSLYLRLRGTNLGLNVANETDVDGNPLSDDLLAPNSIAKAYADLWFYSNPIFVKVE